MNNDAIGFVGTGRMGAPMAGHLLAAGEALVVHDVHPDAARPLVERGALWAASPAEVASRARTIITIVPSSREVEAIYAALLPKLGPGHLMLEMTTADPSSTRRLAKEVQARGAAMLDAPVSGGVRGAVEATLSIMVGGEAADLERARPILARLGKKIFHVGGPGTGHAMKLVNNVTSAACLVATAEAVVVALRAGIDPARAVGGGAGRGGASADAAKQGELLITMLLASTHVETAYLGGGGTREGGPSGRLCIDMSTIDPGASRPVAEAAKRRGVRFVDAP